MKEIDTLKKIFFLIVLCGILIWTITAKLKQPSEGDHSTIGSANSETIQVQNLTKVLGKNLNNKNENPYIISKENIDIFWKNYLSNIDIQNEWIYYGMDGYSIAILGASKDNPKQGTADIISTNSNNEIISEQQLLAPSEGGALSVINEPSVKDFTMDVQDETGRIYLFNFYNGFVAYKDNANGNWKYWAS